MTTLLGILRFFLFIVIALVAGFAAVVASTSANLFLVLGGGLIVFGCSACLRRTRRRGGWASSW